MRLSELVLVVYSIACTVALINAKVTLNRSKEYFETYQKLSEEIEARLKNEIKRLKGES